MSNIVLLVISNWRKMKAACEGQYQWDDVHVASQVQFLPVPFRQLVGWSAKLVTKRFFLINHWFVHFQLISLNLGQGWRQGHNQFSGQVMLGLHTTGFFSLQHTNVSVHAGVFCVFRFSYQFRKAGRYRQKSFLWIIKVKAKITWQKPGHLSSKRLNLLHSKNILVIGSHVSGCISLVGCFVSVGLKLHDPQQEASCSILI